MILFLTEIKKLNKHGDAEPSSSGRSQYMNKVCTNFQGISESFGVLVWALWQNDGFAGVNCHTIDYCHTIDFGTTSGCNMII